MINTIDRIGLAQFLFNVEESEIIRSEHESIGDKILKVFIKIKCTEGYKHTFIELFEKKLIIPCILSLKNMDTMICNSSYINSYYVNKKQNKIETYIYPHPPFMSEDGLRLVEPQFLRM